MTFYKPLSPSTLEALFFLDVSILSLPVAVIMTERYTDPAWPPGTVKLQELIGSDKAQKDARIVLQPRPTSDPNDPLNWSTRQKNLNFFLACYYHDGVCVRQRDVSNMGPIGR